MDEFGASAGEGVLIMSVNGNITIGHFEEANGVICAPNGKVEMGGFSKFTGSIVGNEVSIGAFSELTYDPDLASWEALPGYKLGPLEVRTYNINP